MISSYQKESKHGDNNGGPPTIYVGATNAKQSIRDKDVRGWHLNIALPMQPWLRNARPAVHTVSSPLSNTVEVAGSTSSRMADFAYHWHISLSASEEHAITVTRQSHHTCMISPRIWNFH